MEDIIPFRTGRFTCPLCHTFADQSWFHGQVRFNDHERNQYETAGDIGLCYCRSCRNFSIWKGQEMVYPDSLPVEVPNQDLSEEIVKDYDEAASILNKSPRGAAALLRLGNI